MNSGGIITTIPVVPLVVVAVTSIASSIVLAIGEEAGRAITKAAAADARAEAMRNARAIEAIALNPHPAVRATAYARVVLEMAGAISLTLIAASLLNAWYTVFLAALAAAAAIMLLATGGSPRSVGRKNPTATLRWVAPLMVGLGRVTSPLEKLRRKVDPLPEEEDQEELEAMVHRVAESADIEDDEREMLHSVFELSHTLVREIMVPRTDMLTISFEKPVSEAIRLFVQSGFSRIPVIGENVDDCRGVVYLKDTLRYTWHNPDNPNTPIHQLMRAAVFIPEMKLVDETLAQMQATGVHIAMVFDEYGGVAGLVTIEDILEELVGELVDEHDQSEPDVEAIPGGYKVPARYPLSELGELFGVDIEEDDVDSTGGLVAKALGHVPILGAVAYWNGLRMEVVEMFGRRRLLHTVAVTKEEEE